jgi:hypothetical protein
MSAIFSPISVETGGIPTNQGASKACSSHVNRAYLHPDTGLSRPLRSDFTSILLKVIHAASQRRRTLDLNLPVLRHANVVDGYGPRNHNPCLRACDARERGRPLVCGVRRPWTAHVESEQSHNKRNSADHMARPARLAGRASPVLLRLELTSTARVERRSARLREIDGAPGTTRTCDPQLRKTIRTPKETVSYGCRSAGGCKERHRAAHRTAPAALYGPRKWIRPLAVAGREPSLSHERWRYGPDGARDFRGRSLHRWHPVSRWG